MIKKNKKIMVHAYKRNNWLYRVWEFPLVVEVNKHYVCLSMHNSKIITNEKFSTRSFCSRTSKQSFWFFFYNEWFNIIATLDDGEIDYYINIASPFIYEEEAIKYYDFDLDIKLKTSSISTFRVLDVREYNEHKEYFKYEPGLIEKIDKTLELFQSQDFREEIILKLNKNLIENIAGDVSVGMINSKS